MNIVRTDLMTQFRFLARTKRLLGTLALFVSAPSVLLAAPDPVLDMASRHGITLDRKSSKATAHQLGAPGVSEQTGEATYSFPIPVPPGRAGMQPKLELSYSSRGALRGGIAAGWSLHLPSIRIDPSKGTLGDAQFIASLGGNSSPLVRVPEPASHDGLTYRMERDDAFVRFELVRDALREDPSAGSTSTCDDWLFGGCALDGPVKTASSDVISGIDDVTGQTYGWVARMTDGSVHWFGTTATSTDGISVWYLDRQIDASGNTVEYHWREVVDSQGRVVDYTIEKIDYTSNAQAGLGPHAMVSFDYVEEFETCEDSEVPIGASFSYRSGEPRYEGALRLRSIVSSVHHSVGSGWRNVGTFALGFDTEAMSCEANHSPLRRLASIQHHAKAPNGETTSLPPTTFEYADWSDTPRETRWAQTSGKALHGTDRAVQHMLLQLDGDGVPDRAEVRPNPETGRCEIAWGRGVAGGGFEAIGSGGLGSSDRAELPVLPWRNDVDHPGAGEQCTLMGQVTHVKNKTEDACPSGSYDATGTLLVYRFMDVDGDGLDDLVTAIHADPGLYEPNSYDLGVPSGTSTPVLSLSAVPTDAETSTTTSRIGSLLGGAFTTDAEVNEPAPGTDYETYADDGPGSDYCEAHYEFGQCGFDAKDADPDLYTCSGQPREPEQQGSGYVWHVYRNMGGRFSAVHVGGDGGFRPYFTASAITAPFELAPSGNDGGQPGTGGEIISKDAIIDLDGDGKLDLVDARDPQTWRVRSNRLMDRSTPERPWSTPYLPGGLRAWTSWGVKDGSCSWTSTGQVYCPPSGSFRTRVDLGDLNGDGLPDLLVADENFYCGTMSEEECGTLAYFNTGRGFSDQATRFGSPLQGLSETLTGGVHRTRYLRTDVDGDGLVDMLDLRTTPAWFPNAGDRFLRKRPLPSAWSMARRDISISGGEIDPATKATYRWELNSDYSDADGDGLSDLNQWSEDGVTIHSLAPDAAQPHRLIAIDNGKGGRTRFEYAPANDSEVVSRSPGHERDLPLKLWVVKRITSVEDVVSDETSPDATTTYAYGEPVYDSENGRPEAPHRFLGFSRVVKTLPQGARIDRRYDYATTGDTRGRLESEISFDGDEAVHARSIAGWVQEPLFGGLATFSHAVSERRITCLPDATAESCLQQDSAVLDSSTAWERFEQDGHAVFYATALEDSHGQSADATQWLWTKRQHAYTYGPDRYLVVPAFEEKSEGSLGKDPRTVSRVELEHDERGRVIARHVWIGDETVATTRFTHDAAGNVLTKTRPAQAGGVSTTYAYDDHGLFVATTTNELGHQVQTANDPGTGILVERSGPNPDQLEGWEIDGFGRVIEHLVSVVAGKQNQGFVTMQTHTYHDHELPRRRESRHRVDFGGTTWTYEASLFDGFDRLVSVSDGFAETRHRYDAGGFLVSTELPDPSDANGTARYEYDRDQLGRVLQMTRPDQTAISVTRTGLIEIRNEESGDGSGGAKEYERDVFGRIVRVVEYGGVGGDAVTDFYYDALGNVEQIEDADGNSTLLEYDLAGRRTAIQRSDRLWQYEYDLNSNLISQIGPDGEATTTRYDELDRIIEHVPASRGMSAERQKELGIGRIRFEYDAPSYQRIGRLFKVRMPYGTIIYSYDTRGLPVTERRNFKASFPVAISAGRTVTRRFNALGAVEFKKIGNVRWRTTYDERGLPVEVEWRNPNIKWTNLARFERTALGQVSLRESDYGQGREFGYDALGRVVTDRILAAGVERSSREYEYNDSGDLAQVRGSTGGRSAAASFGYDGLHRVMSASGPAGYEANIAYSPAGNVHAASIDWNGATTPRDATYVYGAMDPQAVDRLVDSFGGDYEFDYDLAGNMIRRLTPDGSQSFSWDGDNQLREAIDGQGNREIYFYDQTGQRVMAANDAGARFWFHEAEDHFDSTGLRTKSYVHIGTSENTLARVENDIDLEFQYSDALRNLMLALDASGSPVASFLYGAFGETVHAEGGETHRRQFNGKERDAATGLHYYGFRYYDPVVLRWNSADPLYQALPDLATLEPQRMNRYAFSLNNPLKFYDPDGRDPLIVFGGGGHRNLFRDSGRLLAKTLKSKYKIKNVPEPVHVSKLKNAAAKARAQGRKVTSVIYIGHGNPGNVRPGGGKDLPIADMVKDAGLGKGGAVVTIGCRTAQGVKYDGALSEISDQGIKVAGFGRRGAITNLKGDERHGEINPDPGDGEAYGVNPAHLIPPEQSDQGHKKVGHIVRDAQKSAH
jgi:RHS repeat-associated protein